MKRISARQVQSSERFYRIPKIFVESPLYKPMSTDAKFTYAILKDRFELSLRNNWIDKNGDVYLIYTVTELQEILGYGNIERCNFSGNTAGTPGCSLGGKRKTPHDRIYSASKIQ